MINKKIKFIFYLSFGIISLLISNKIENIQENRKKILGVADFASPIQVISNISGGLVEPDSSFDNPYDIATDTQGNIYVTDSNNNRIQKYNIGTSTWTIIGSAGTDAGQFSSPSGILIDNNNNIYVADSSNSRIQKYDIGTSSWSVFGSSGANAGQFNFPMGIDLDNIGNIYIADTYNHRIQKYDIGTTTWIVLGSSGQEVGEFNSPIEISVDTSGNIFVLERGNHRIQKYDIGTTTWTVTGSQGEGVGQFYYPNGMTLDDQNNIYVTDRCGGQVEKYSNELQTWSLIGDSDHYCNIVSFKGNSKKIVNNLKNYFRKFFKQVFAVTLIPQGDFDDLRGITVDSLGNVYVVDGGNNRIQKYDPNTTTWTAMGSFGTGLGQFNEPLGIDLDTYGNIYITDSSRIQKYDVDTSNWSVLGDGGIEVGQFDYPRGLVVDISGNIFVSDSSNDRIQKYDIGTSSWSVLGSGGTGIGQFSYPIGISIDNNNNIYVADSENHRIQKYDIGTSSWSVLGSGGTDVGQFNYPVGISIDNNNNIYVSDSSHRIQKYDIGSSNWSVLGSGGTGVGQFNYPGGIDIDNIGNIYVADTENHRIQKYNIETEIWSTIGEFNGSTNNMIYYKLPNKLINQFANLFKNIVKKVLATVSVYFSYPTDLVIDNVGNVYVVDSGNSRIQKLMYYFAPTFTVNYSAQENGFITGNTTQSLAVGQSSTPVVAIGNENYAFLQWSDGSIANPRFDIGTENDLNVTAEFTDTRIISNVDATNISTEISREFIDIDSTNPTLVSNFTFNINYTFLTGASSLIFPAQTIVTPVGDSTVDLTQFQTIDNTTDTKNKLNKTIKSLLFGIPNINLTFSKPVTVTLPVGSNYNNQTLQVKYHRDIDPDTVWNNETTCVIINGNCTFQTTHATTFSVLENSTQSSNNNNSPVSSNIPDRNCHSSKPLYISDLFQVNTTNNTAKIYFTPQRDTSDYVISFSSINKNAEEHGETVSLLREGVQSHTIYSLKPNTTYYVKVRGQNGCMPGDWSNIMTFKTNSKIYYRYTLTTRTNDYIKKTTKSIKKAVTKTLNEIILPKTFGD